MYVSFFVGVHDCTDRHFQGKLALYDILTEDSLVTYWEKFTDIAFEEKSKAILTGCTLKPHPSTPSGTVRRCSFCFTINRDSHGV